MQNWSEVEELFKLTARACKSDPSRSCTLIEHMRFSLLVAGRQHVTRREYRRALLCKELLQFLKHYEDVKSAWNDLQLTIARDLRSTQKTPASNTGVTDTSAAVPLEYFERHQK